MAKKQFSPKPYFYPKPAVLVGAMVRGRPNFLVIANCGIAAWEPPTIFISSSRNHYTNLGIRKHQVFSVNIPSAKLASAVDYCGIYSGRRVDKSRVFEVFFGELKDAPLIRECPVNYECRVTRTWRWATEEVFCGEIVAIHVDERCLTAGRPDIRKINPLIYSTSDKKYYRLGAEIGRAYQLGKKKP